jgi:hypothetical protein
MPSLTDRLRALVGRRPKLKQTAKPPARKTNSILPPSERAALIADAMAIYRQNAVGVRGVIEGALKQLRDHPPNIRDEGAYARLFSIYQAYLALRRLMNHRERRYLVLAGLREWLEQRPAPPTAGRKVVRR